MITRQIREILNPYLVWESRVNLNVALPKSSRVYTRFSREDCDRHENSVWVDIFKEKLTSFENRNTPQTRAEASYRLFEHFNNPRAYTLVERHLNFKMAVIERLLCFSDKKELRLLGVNSELSEKLSRLCKNLIPKMLSLKYVPMRSLHTCRIQIV